MPRFYLVNEKRFPLPVDTPVRGREGVNQDLLPYYRWEHRVTVGCNGRRYMIFLDNLKHQAYVEDATNGLEKINDEELWRELVDFATSNGYLMLMPPMMKNKEERFI